MFVSLMMGHVGGCERWVWDWNGSVAHKHLYSDLTCNSNLGKTSIISWYNYKTETLFKYKLLRQKTNKVKWKYFFSVPYSLVSYWPVNKLRHTNLEDFWPHSSLCHTPMSHVCLMYLCHKDHPCFPPICVTSFMNVQFKARQKQLSFKETQSKYTT